MDKNETRKKIAGIMDELGANCLNVISDPDKRFDLEFWRVGDEIVIVQIWEEGGCNHFIQGAGNTWDAMETQLYQIDAKTA
jgi:hypothetical protein